MEKRFWNNAPATQLTQQKGGENSSTAGNKSIICVQTDVISNLQIARLLYNF